MHSHAIVVADNCAYDARARFGDEMRRSPGVPDLRISAKEPAESYKLARGLGELVAQACETGEGIIRSLPPVRCVDLRPAVWLDIDDEYDGAP